RRSLLLLAAAAPPVRAAGAVARVHAAARLLAQTPTQAAQLLPGGAVGGLPALRLTAAEEGALGPWDHERSAHVLGQEPYALPGLWRLDQAVLDDLRPHVAELVLEVRRGVDLASRSGRSGTRP